MLELGIQAFDVISGLTGTVTARAEYLHGGDRIQLTSGGLDEQGKPREGEWFDAEQVISSQQAEDTAAAE